jgi:hypothetical protein
MEDSGIGAGPARRPGRRQLDSAVLKALILWRII